MSKNLNQVPTAATSVLSTDKMYIARSPFGVTDDRYILGSSLITQFAAPLTTKGDLYTWSTTDARLPVGTIDGQILQVNAASAVGLAWSTATYPVTTTANQLLYSSSTNVVAGLTSAASAVLITSAGSVPSLSQTLPSAVQDNITRLGTITNGVWNGTTIVVANGGTGATSFTAYMPVCGGTTTTGILQSVSTAGAVAGYALTYVSNAALPTWQAVGAPFTPAALTKTDDTNVTLTLGGSPNTALLQATSLTLGWTGLLGGARGGTGVNNGTFTATYAGNLNFAAAFSTSGGFAVTQTYTGITNVTFPTSGTLATTSQLPTPAALTKTDDTNVTVTLGGTPATALLQATSLTLGWTGQLSLARGGTNANLTASNGGIVWSNASQMQILGGTATAGQMLQSGSTAAPTWSTTTWPATSTAGRMLYSTFNNVIGELTTTARAVLTSGATSVPAWIALTDGQIVIGSTAGAPAAASLTAGSGITITPGSNSISIAVTGGGVTPAALTKTDDTNVTLTLGGTPSTALLQATSLTLGWTGQLGLTRGGTAASLTASNGGIVYSNASALAILAGTATAGLALLSGASTTPTWSIAKPITQIAVQRITASGAGTYTPTAGMVYVIVCAQAAGGGGGGCITSSAAQFALSAAGGGGEYIEAVFQSSDIGGSKGYVVGTKGSKGAAGNHAGTAGTNTTFNTTWVIATGGALGAAGAGSAAGSQYFQVPGAGATGGSVATGTLIKAINGGAFGPASAGTTQALVSQGGNAGSGQSTYAPLLTGTTFAGINGTLGSGGSGAGSFNAGTQQAGGDGGDGFITFIEFLAV